MVLSHLLFRPKTPSARFAPGLFLGLLIAFTIFTQTNPAFGLAGLGTVLIVTGVLIVLNRQRIWETYRKSFRKSQGIKGIWTKPNPVYYTINVMFLWPFVIFIGFICLWVSYNLTL